MLKISSVFPLRSFYRRLVPRLLRKTISNRLTKYFVGGRIFYLPKYLKIFKSYFRVFKKNANPPKLPPVPIDLLEIPLEYGHVNPPFGSDLCRFEDMHAPEYRAICNDVFKLPVNYQRKQWEWIYIYFRLFESKVLEPNKKGLGFGVGTEPLAAIFANLGCEVLATDAPAENNSEWLETGQHSSDISSLQHENIINNKEFNRLCSFKTLDMNIHQEIPDGYDFQWSSCVIEHLGGLDKIVSFLIASSSKLNNGGIAVHTTELNLTSNEKTYDHPQCYVFRRCDLDRLSEVLERNNLEMKSIIYNVGSHPYNYVIDIPDINGFGNDLHLRSLIAGYVCTSVGLVIRKVNFATTKKGTYTLAGSGGQTVSGVNLGPNQMLVEIANHGYSIGEVIYWKNTTAAATLQTDNPQTQNILSVPDSGKFVINTTFQDTSFQNGSCTVNTS